MVDFTDEQKAAIAEIVNASIKAANDKQVPDDKKDGKEGKEGEGKQKTVTQEAQEALNAEKAAEEALVTIQDSVKFNLGIKDFAEKNKSLLPEESLKILTAIESKTFKNDNEKANTVRKSFLDSFLEKQENIDVLIPSMKARAEQYKSLAESDKERRSKEFWDLVEAGVALKQGVRKAEALNKINGGNAGDASSNPLEAKILAAAKKKFNNETK